MKYNNTENYFKFKNYNVFYKIINNSDSNNGILFLHGKGGHSGHLDNILDKKELNNFKFFSLDFPGWGKSSGKRGHINSFKTYINLINYFINNIINKYNIKNLFIIGESLSSLIAFCVSKNSNISIIKGLGFIPGIYEVEQLNNILNKIIIYSFNFILPKFSITTKKPVEMYTDDSDYQNKLKNDPLWERKISIRTIYEINKYLKYLKKYIPYLNTPLLIIHSKIDSYNKGDITDIFLKKVPKKDKNKIIILEKSKHWLLGGIELDKIKFELYKWIKSIL